MYSFDVPDEARKQVELQYLLTNITDQNIQETIHQIKESEYVQTDSAFYQLCTEIRRLPRIRPLSVDIVTELIGQLNASFPEKKIIETVFEENIVVYHADIALLRKCFKAGFVSRDFILKYYKKLTNKVMLFCFYFAPDFEELALKIAPSNNIIESELDQYICEIPELSNNNYQLLSELLDYGWYKDSLGYFLKYDDINSLQLALAKNNELIYSTVKSDFEPGFSQPMSLINAAAFYGSIKCFKYLFMNNAAFDEATAKNSVIGGNYEIVHICQQQGLQFDEQALAAAVEYLRNDIFAWITIQGICASTFYLSVVKNNVLALVYFISQGFSVTFNENEWTTPLHVAVRCGSLSVIDYLISTGCSTEAVDENGLTPCDLAETSNEKMFITYCKNQHQFA